MFAKRGIFQSFKSNLLDAKAVASRRSIYGAVFTHDSQDMARPAASVRWRWIMEGHRKLIIPNPAREPGAVPELYDVALDDEETRNLAADRPEEVNALTRRLDEWWTP